MIEIVKSVTADLGTSVKTVEPPRAVPARMYRLGHQDDISQFLHSGNSTFTHFACNAGWDKVENFGRWMRRPGAGIKFATELGEGEPILVVLEIFTVGWLRSTQLQITINGADYAVLKLAPGEHRCLSMQVTSDRGRLSLEFAPIGDIATGPDPRSYLWFGVGSIGYAPSNDPLSRVTLLEEFVYRRAQGLDHAVKRIASA